MVARGALKALPVQLAGKRRVVQFLGDIPVPLRLHQRDLAQNAAVDELFAFDNRFRAAALHAHLHDLFSTANGLHDFGALFERMGHRLFQIDVLLRVQRGLQAGIVVVVGRGDDYGIDAALPQQFPVIGVAGRSGRVGACLFEVRFVNVGNRDALRTQFLKIAAEIAAATARPDDSIRQPVIGAPN